MLTRSELETTLREVEACINSRPLTYVGTDPDGPVPLTPSHFLLGRSFNSQPEVEERVVTSRDLAEKSLSWDHYSDIFWEKWRCDYLRNLPPAIKKFRSKSNLEVGSVVLVNEDNVPRMKWPLAVVVELYRGRDNLVRSVKLRTAKGIISRPFQRLYCLEMIMGENSDMEPTQLNEDKVYITRFGRKVVSRNLTV
ncbi:hypothetical protein HOLleu_13381 [Holothuria leucospilota]|uniref:DUF5641 domain-containing protein n=1 Tax=Holothuria leucospilota TaxID=206669 RepID=A0A9Q1CCF2_HOLLE|nr:hypothetical protein HOLleu_13381 [Holothuria leucospilota]